jgi:PhnB protein
MHASVNLGETMLLGTDGAMDPSNPPVPDGFSLALAPASVEESERLFNELSVGGQIFMPIQQTFWATRFGSFKDQFGICWMINYDAPKA